MPEPVNVTLDIASYGMPVPEFIDWIRGGLGGEFEKVADDIEGQLEPSVDEPQEFGSIVRAACNGTSDRILWCRGAGHWWFSEQVGRALFADLHNPEVLRVGVGPSLDAYHRESWRNGYKLATENTRQRITSRLAALKRDLITAPERNAIDKALAEIEKDADDTITGRGCPS